MAKKGQNVPAKRSGKGTNTNKTSKNTAVRKTKTTKKVGFNNAKQPNNMSRAKLFGFLSTKTLKSRRIKLSETWNARLDQLVHRRLKAKQIEGSIKKKHQKNNDRIDEIYEHHKKIDVLVGQVYRDEFQMMDEFEDYKKAQENVGKSAGQMTEIDKERKTIDKELKKRNQKP
jgi:hypothetical protein